MEVQGGEQPSRLVYSRDELLGIKKSVLDLSDVYAALPHLVEPMRSAPSKIVKNPPPAVPKSTYNGRTITRFSSSDLPSFEEITKMAQSRINTPLAQRPTISRQDQLKIRCTLRPLMELWARIGDSASLLLFWPAMPLGTHKMQREWTPHIAAEGMKAIQGEKLPVPNVKAKAFQLLQHIMQSIATENGEEFTRVTLLYGQKVGKGCKQKVLQNIINGLWFSAQRNTNDTKIRNAATNAVRFLATQLPKSKYDGLFFRSNPPKKKNPLSHPREVQHIPNRRTVRKEHHQAI